MSVKETEAAPYSCRETMGMDEGTPLVCNCGSFEHATHYFVTHYCSQCGHAC